MSRCFIDAGHGGSDPGAVANGLKEADLAIKVAGYMATYLKNNYVCEVYKDITADSTHTISARANKWKADLFVSIHFNAGVGDGWEGWLYSSANDKLGEAFQKQVKAVGQNSRGLKYSKTLNVLRLTDMPAILNEVAFIDNKKDIKDWSKDADLKKMGEAFAKAVASYLGLKKKESGAEMQIKTKTVLNRRTGPGSNFKKLGTRSKGITLDIFEVSEDKKWGYVNDDWPGWVSLDKEYVTKL